MNTRIIFINPPQVILENGDELRLSDVQGSPRIGAVIERIQVV